MILAVLPIRCLLLPTPPLQGAGSSLSIGTELHVPEDSSSGLHLNAKQLSGLATLPRQLAAPICLQTHNS